MSNPILTVSRLQAQMARAAQAEKLVNGTKAWDWPKAKSSRHPWLNIRELASPYKFDPEPKAGLVAELERGMTAAALTNPFFVDGKVGQRLRMILAVERQAYTFITAPAELGWPQVDGEG